jgi:hypothetical protein
MTFYSPQGTKLQYAIETALGTPGSWYDIYDDGCDFPPNVLEVYMPEMGGLTNPADVLKPIQYVAVKENALKLPLLLRRHTSTDTPLVGHVLQSGGWSEAKLSAAGQTDTGTAVDAIVWDNDDGCENASMALIEVTSGYYEPVLIAGWTVGTKTGVPTMDLPANPGTGKIIQQMFCYSPRTGPVSSTKTMQIRRLLRAQDGSSNPQLFTASAVSFTLNTINISQNQPVKLDFSGHCIFAGPTDGSWATDSFVERVELNLTAGDFVCRFAAGAAGAGGITRAVKHLESATITPNIKSMPAKMVGGDGYYDLAGYNVEYDKANPTTVELNGTFEAAMWDDFATSYIEGGSGTNQNYVLEFAHPTRNLNIPAHLIALPSVHLSKSPEFSSKEGDGYVRGKLTFAAKAAALGGDDGPTTAGDQQLYIGISGQET